MTRARTALTGGVASALLLLCHCILPPPVVIDVTTNTPPSVNYAETIPAKGNLSININCSVCTLQIKVDDPDPDPLEMRGFLDGGSSVVCEGKQGAVASGIDRDPLSCIIHPDKLFALDTTSTLEVWVSDKNFPYTVATQIRTLADGAAYTIARWSITAEQRGLACDDREHLGCK